MACKYYINDIEISEIEAKTLFAEAVAEVGEYNLDKVFPILTDKINNYGTKNKTGTSVLWTNSYGNKGVLVSFEKNYLPENKYKETNLTESDLLISGKTKNGEYRRVEVLQQNSNGGLTGQGIKGLGVYKVIGNPSNRNITAIGLSLEDAKSLAYKILDVVTSDENIKSVDVNFNNKQENATQKVSKQESVQGEREKGSTSGKTNQASSSNSIQREKKSERKVVTAKNLTELIKQAAENNTKKVEVVFKPAYNEAEHAILDESIKEILKKPKVEVFDVTKEGEDVISLINSGDVESVKFVKEPVNKEKQKEYAAKITEKGEQILAKFGALKNITPQQKTELIQDIKELFEGIVGYTYEEVKALLMPYLEKIGLSQKDADEIFFEATKELDLEEEFPSMMEEEEVVEVEEPKKPTKKEKVLAPDEREKSLLTRAYKEQKESVVLDLIENLGLTYIEEPNKVAAKKADEFLDRVGYENAKKHINALEGATRAIVWGKLIDLAKAGVDNASNSEELAKYTEDLKDFLNMADSSARDAGRFIQALSWVYNNSKFGYNLEAIKKRAVAANDGFDISAETEAKLKESVQKIEDLQNEISELQKKQQEELENLALEKIKEQAEYEKKIADLTKGKKPTYNTQQRLDKAIEITKGLRSKIKANSYGDVGIVAAIDAGLAVLEVTLKTTKNVSIAINKAIEEIDKLMGDKPWNKDKFRKDVEAEYQKEGIDLDEDVTDSQNIPHSLIKELVASGINDINELVKAVNKKMGIPNTANNIRKTRDDITGYGKSLQYERPQIEEQISQLKGVGRLLSAIEDVKKGQRSKRTGRQRRELIEKERTLMKQLRELTKNLPLSEADLTKYHKTALDAMKKRIKNRIEELNAEIKRAEEIGAEEAKKEKQGKVNKKTELDAEALLLKEELEETKLLHDEMFKDIPETAEEKVQRILNAIENSEKRYQEKIDSGKFIPTPKEPLPDDPRIIEAQEKLEAKKKEFQEKKAAAEPANYAEEKKIEQLQKQLDDLLKGRYNNQVPRPSNPDSQRIKDLKEQIYQAKVNLGLLLSPLQTELNKKIAAKRNAIAKVQEQLISGNLVNERNVSSITSPELERLKREHENLLDQLVEARKTDPVYLKSVELKKEAASIKADEKKLNELKAKIAQNDLEKEKVKQRAEKNLQQRLRQFKIEKQKAILQQLRDEAGLAQKEIFDKIERAKERKLKELRHRLQTGNFEKGTFKNINGILGRFKPKKEVVPQTNKRIQDLNSQIAQEKRKIDVELERIALAQRNITEKFLDILAASLDIPRTLMATGEFSAIAVQGFKPLITHPTLAVKALKNMFVHLASEKSLKQWEKELEQSPYYEEMLQAKLGLTDPTREAIQGVHEEALANNLINYVWNKTAAKGLQYVPDIRQIREMIKEGKYKELGIESAEAANFFKAFERAQSALLNTLRVEMYLQGRRQLTAIGKTIETHPKEFKDLASVVNQSTGRANLTGFESANGALSKIFFSARNFMSTLLNSTLLAFPYYLSLGNTPFEKKNAGTLAIWDSITKPSVAQKMFVGDLAKFYGLVAAATYITGQAVAYAYGDDDDDEKRVQWNPLSSNYGSIKLTPTTRISLAGQVTKLITYQARMITGELMNAKGQIKKLGEGYTKTASELTTDLFVNRFSPIASFIWGYLTKEEQPNGKFENARGEEYVLWKELSRMFYPIFFGTAYKESTFEQEKKVAMGSILLAGLGFNVSTADDSQKAYYTAIKEKPELDKISNNGIIIKQFTPFEVLPESLKQSILEIATEEIAESEEAKKRDPSKSVISVEVAKKQAKDKVIEAYNLMNAPLPIHDIALESNPEKQEKMYLKYRDSGAEPVLTLQLMESTGISKERARYLYLLPN